MLVLQASTAGLICFARPAKSCQRSSKKQLLTKVVCFRCWLSFQSRPCRHRKLQQTSDGFHPRKQCKQPQFNGNSACFHSKQGSASSSTTECAHPQSRHCRLQYKQYKPRPLKHNSATLPSKAVQTHAKQCWLSSQARQCRHSRASPSTTVLAFIPGIAVQAKAQQCWLSSQA